MTLGCDFSCCSSHSASERMRPPMPRRCLRPPGLRRAAQQQAQQRREFLAHVAPIDDQIEGAVIEQELAALETFGQGFTHGLLDHARTGETDERAWLGDVEVAKHGEARGYTTGGRIGHHGDERQAGLRQPRQRGGGLGHLQQ